jgi:hypothetical protein
VSLVARDMVSDRAFIIIVERTYRKAIDPPKIEAMDAAWKTLLDLGAVEGEAMTSRLTALGRHVSIACCRFFGSCQADLIPV